MRFFSPAAAVVGPLILTGLILACAGDQPGPQNAPADVQQERLPAPAPAAPAGPSRPQSDAPQSDAAGAGTSARERSGRIKFMYEDIYFKRGSTRLDAAAKELLDEKARWLHAHPEVSVVIEGHTDYNASREYNLALGDRRSGAVKSYLIRKGIASERLMAISYGRERPVAAGKNEADRGKNRRVHFVIEER